MVNSYTVNFTNGNLAPVVIGDLPNISLKPYNESTPVPSGRILFAHQQFETSSLMLLNPFPQSKVLMMVLEFKAPREALDPLPMPPARDVAVSTPVGSVVVPSTKEENIRILERSSDPQDPALPVKTEWGVTIVAKDGDETDAEGDHRIAAVCQFRPDGFRLTMPDAHVYGHSEFVPKDKFDPNAFYKLELQINRQKVGPAWAKAELTVLAGGEVETRTSGWLEHRWFPADSSTTDTSIKAVGPSVHLHAGQGLVSAQLLRFYVETREE